MPLALALIHARPESLLPHEQKTLDRLAQATRDLQAVLDQRSRIGSVRVRPRLDQLTRAWSSCSELLVAYARLDSPFGRRAEALHGVLFASGLSFLSTDAHAMWSEAQRRLARLRADSSSEELSAVVGTEVTAWITLTTSELGEVLGTGSARIERQDPGALSASIKSLQAAIVGYARALSATVDGEDPDAAERFRRAMAPLDAYRASRGRRTARTSSARTGGADVDPTEAEPVVTPPAPTDATPETTVR